MTQEERRNRRREDTRKAVTIFVAALCSLRENQEYEGRFKFADADKWERITQENVGRQLALAVNGVIKSAPIVNESITGGHCSVIGPDLDKLLK